MRTARKNFILNSCDTLKVSVNTKAIENGTLARVFEKGVGMVRKTSKGFINIACKMIVSHG
jgi:hypothetical protein